MGAAEKHITEDSGAAAAAAAGAAVANVVCLPSPRKNSLSSNSQVPTEAPDPAWHVFLFCPEVIP